MPDENKNQCPCDCHRADAGGLICSRCWRNHSADEAERQVARDIPVILRAFAQEDDDEAEA